MAVAASGISLDEFLKLPEEKPALEFIDGVIEQKVSPKGRHGFLQGELIKRLDQAGIPNKVARAIPELRETFAGASVVPDISVFRWKRLPMDGSGEVADNFLEAPDIAIEIASPEQSTTALVRKCLWYVAHGVQVALLVDPVDRSVLAFRPDRLPIAWHGGDHIDLHDILPDFDLTVEQLFAALQLR